MSSLVLVATLCGAASPAWAESLCSMLRPDLSDAGLAAEGSSSGCQLAELVVSDSSLRLDLTRATPRRPSTDSLDMKEQTERELGHLVQPKLLEDADAGRTFSLDGAFSEDSALAELRPGLAISRASTAHASGYWPPLLVSELPLFEGQGLGLELAKSELDTVIALSVRNYDALALTPPPATLANDTATWTFPAGSTPRVYAELHYRWWRHLGGLARIPALRLRGIYRAGWLPAALDDLPAVGASAFWLWCLSRILVKRKRTADARRGGLRLAQLALGVSLFLLPFGALRVMGFEHDFVTGVLALILLVECAGLVIASRRSPTFSRFLGATSGATGGLFLFALVSGCRPKTSLVMTILVVFVCSTGLIGTFVFVVLRDLGPKAFRDSRLRAASSSLAIAALLSGPGPSSLANPSLSLPNAIDSWVSMATFLPSLLVVASAAAALRADHERGTFDEELVSGLGFVLLILVFVGQLAAPAIGWVCCLVGGALYYKVLASPRGRRPELLRRLEEICADRAKWIQAALSASRLPSEYEVDEKLLEKEALGELPAEEAAARRRAAADFRIKTSAAATLSDGSDAQRFVLATGPSWSAWENSRRAVGWVLALPMVVAVLFECWLISQGFQPMRTPWPFLNVSADVLYAVTPFLALAVGFAACLPILRGSTSTESGIYVFVALELALFLDSFFQLLTPDRWPLVVVKTGTLFAMLVLILGVGFDLATLKRGTSWANAFRHFVALEKATKLVTVGSIATAAGGTVLVITGQLGKAVSFWLEHVALTGGP